MIQRLFCLLPLIVLGGCGGGGESAAAANPTLPAPSAPAAEVSSPFAPAEVPAPSAPVSDAPSPTAPPAAEPAPVRATVWLSTYDGSQRLAKQEPVEFSASATQVPGTFDIDVDETRTYQTMAGFGASMTDSSAWLIGTRLSTEQRDELMTKLFDPEQGIGLSQVRHGIGASDFSLQNYSYSDAPQDNANANAPHFSIDYERSYFLPVMKQALSINPELRIMGTPWSAPAWMKTQSSLNAGSLRPDMHASFAKYLVDYLQAFEQEGVPIESITIQNEPLHESQGYPTMRMEAAEQANFIANHLGPALMQAGLETRVFLYDHNWDQPEYPLEVLNHAGARQFATGTAFHCYGGDVSAQSRVQEMHPDKEIRLTECTGSVGSEFGSDMHWWMRNLFIGGTRHWASAVLMWNLALDENSGPQNGGCTSCRGVVTIDQDTGHVTYNGEYYALGHASLAARPGATRIESSRKEGVFDSVAFVNPDGSKGLLVLNERNEATPITIRWQDLSLDYELPAQAVVTFRWP